MSKEEKILILLNLFFGIFAIIFWTRYLIFHIDMKVAILFNILQFLVVIITIINKKYIDKK